MCAAVMLQVCWKFRGKKFDRAMKLHTVVVNHHWFEDSLRAGRRLPEEPYKLQRYTEREGGCLICIKFR